MQAHPVLGQVALGYSPVLDRQRAVVATRLTIFPQPPDAVPDGAALLHALQSVWPAAAGDSPVHLTLRSVDGGARGGPGAQGAQATRDARGAGTLGGVARPVSLNIAGEGLLRAVMAASPPPHFMIEVPAFMAADAALAPALRALHDAGTALLIKGRPLSALPAELLPCFAHAIIDVDEERRTEIAPPTTARPVTTVQAGTRSTASADQAFARGAVAVLGWPFDDARPEAGVRRTVPPDVRVVLELINGVDREEPPARLEESLKRDPALAFKLLRYLNSPAFGLRVEVNSFAHAVMLLGHQRLKRWLTLLLASASKVPSAPPLMHAAVRRGLLMEELVRGNGDDEMRGEMFLCGVFSLLEPLLQQPLEELLQSVPVPERVQQALRGQGGPYLPYLDLVRAIEQESVLDMRECSERLLLGAAEVNRAVLAALLAATRLDG